MKRIQNSLPLGPLCKTSFKQWETCGKELWCTGDFKCKLFSLSASCCGASRHSCSFLFPSHFSLPLSPESSRGTIFMVGSLRAELWRGCQRQGQAPASAASPVPAFTLSKYTPALGGGEINIFFFLLPDVFYNCIAQTGIYQSSLQGNELTMESVFFWSGKTGLVIFLQPIRLVHFFTSPLPKMMQTIQKLTHIPGVDAEATTCCPLLGLELHQHEHVWQKQQNKLGSLCSC